MILLRIIKEKFVITYFFFLFVFLTAIYLYSFFDPPRSDYWSLFFFFHHINVMPGEMKWLHILNYDPLHQVNFYPLAHLIIYAEYIIFGSNHLYFHAIHFILYCVSLVLLYRLARVFCEDRLLILMFISVFTFLFSHFDVIIWSYHTNIILAFCLFLAGFLLYLNFLKTGGILNLVLATVSFLSAMLCYLTVVLWPLAIINLSYLNRPGGIKVSRAKKRISYLSVIAAVYLLYIAFFFATRALKTYGFPLLIPLVDVFSVHKHVLAFFSVFFNILYNGILINIAPFLACPVKILENIELGGLLVFYEPEIEKIVYIGGTFFLVVASAILVYLLRRRRYELIKALFFLSLLLFSELFILLRLRLIVNETEYALQQFRYQYIVNAFVILITLLITSDFIGSSKRRRRVTYSVLCIVLAVNIYFSVGGVSFVSSRLAPLKKMTYNIKQGIKNGSINSEHKIYIDDGITKKLSSLCWNDYMGSRYMEGTYQWMFNDKEINYFAFSPEEAKWTIDENDFNITRK